LARRVEEWDERIKNRRDKREIRMLTNWDLQGNHPLND
jgi:tRNA A-37 threonylcarbamoyl transferase component Bud32